MKKIILSVALAIASTMSAGASPISGSQAAKIANNFIKGRPSMYAASAVTMTAQTDIQPYYVFNIGDNEGFVIVAGDDAVSPIIAYSYTGSFKTEGMPENLKSTMQKYAYQLAEIQKRNIPARALVRTAGEQLEAIKPMLRSKWNQDAPYNNDCPDFGDGKCYAGCVPVAMSQMMNYHQWPVQQVSKIPGYEFEQFTWEPTDAPITRSLDALPPTTFDWQGAAIEQIGNPRFDKAVAEIIRYAGQSLMASYGTDATGGFSIDMIRGLVKYFDYNEYQILLNHNDFNDETLWRSLVYNELKNNRPVIFEGEPENDFGHEFVCDGYENGKYHINWGWGGYCNGFFELDNLNPEGSGIGGVEGANYSFNYGVVLNSQPAAHSYMVYSDRITVQRGATQPLDLKFNCGKSTYTSVQFDLSLPKGITLVEETSGMPKVKLNFEGDHTVECNRLSNGDYRFVVASPTNSELKLMSDSFLSLEMAVAADAVINDKVNIVTKNGVVCNTDYKGFDFYPYSITLLLPDEELNGDLNADGKVDNDDLALLEEAVQTCYLGYVDEKAADIDHDGTVDVADYILLMDKVRKLNGEKTYFKPTLNEGIISVSEIRNPVQKGDKSAYIFPTLANLPSAKAVQFTMKIKNGAKITKIWTGVDERTADNGFYIYYQPIRKNTYRITLTNKQSKNIGSHFYAIAGMELDNLPDLEIEYSDIVLVTSDYKKLSSKKNNQIYSGIEDVIVPEKQIDDNRTYTLDGIQVNDTDNLPAGVYIRNGKKVIVK